MKDLEKQQFSVLQKHIIWRHVFRTPGCRLENEREFFHEFVTVSETPAEKILEALEEEGILGGYPLDEHRILWCCTEMNSKEEIDRTAAIVKGV